jgi:hypothetical protein
MSDQNRQNSIYLFEMRNNKKKLAYGKTAEDALAILSLRLTTKEMEQIIQDKYSRIKRKDILYHVDQLG